MSSNKGGRPTKYKKEYCEMLVNHMAKGLSFESFGGEIDVWKEALYNWVKRYPEFSNAKDRGHLKGLLFMEKIGQAATMGKIPGFNYRPWLMKMKNSFGYKDRLDITSEDEKVETVTIYLPDNGLKINED